MITRNFVIMNDGTMYVNIEDKSKGFEFDPQCFLVDPRDVQSSRLADDAGCAKCPALLAGLRVLGDVPLL